MSEQGTISLPLLGQISVSGMTQQDFINDLSNRTRKYVYHPQVEVFLLHSENREVAVLGSVKKPGRYMLTSRSDTIMTMISRAGGLNTDAAAPAAARNSPDSGIGDEGTKSGAQRFARFRTSRHPNRRRAGFESGPGSAARPG